MTAEPVTQLPPGYDDCTKLSLTLDNVIVITHPVLPPMFYDETVMRWVSFQEKSA